MLCPACHACVRGGRRAGIVARMSTFTRHPLTAYLYAKMGLFHVSIVSPIGVSARLRCYGLHVICLCNYRAKFTAVITCNYSPVQGRVRLPRGDLRSESRPVRPPTTRSRGGRVRPPTHPPDAERASVRPPTRSFQGGLPSFCASSRSRSSRSRSWSLHHRHDGALDCHVMNCSALAPRYEAFNLSSQVHLPANV